MKKITILMIIIFSSILLYSQNYEGSKMPALTKMILNQGLDYSKNQDLKQSTINLDYPFVYENDKLFVELLIYSTDKSTKGQLTALGCKIITTVGNIYAISAPIESIPYIEQLDAVKQIEASQMLYLEMDQSKKTINAERVYRDDLLEPTIIGGEGVILGVFDTGIDFTHPDFSDANGTRILKLWDVSDSSGINMPDNYEFGREYDKSEIDGSPESVLQADYSGHGTHVAGTAAGNGSADSAMRGVAYNADLIIIKGNRREDRVSFSQVDIIAGCNYIFEQAELMGKPAVINLSIGSVLGSHDGKGLHSMALSEMTGEGKLVVASAGNSGNMPIHAGGEVEANEVVEFPILSQNVCNMFRNYCPEMPNYYMTAADFWHSTSIIDSVIIIAYKSTPIGIEKYFTLAIDPNESFSEFLLEDELGDILAFLNFRSTPLLETNNSGNILIQLHNGGIEAFDVARFLWSVAFKVKSPGTIDMWGTLPLPYAFPFTPSVGERYFSGNNSMTVGAPSDGDSIICVGSFASKNKWIDKNNELNSNQWQLGALSFFSSRGPDRFGRMLPLITGPGQTVFAAKSKDYNANDDMILEGDYYTGMMGTSMSGPHVAGAVALMLQVNPKLRFSDIVDIFKNTARRDNFTGNEPNNSFGYGKIDVQAAIKYILGTTGVNYVYAYDVKVYPNPAVSQIVLEIDDFFDNPTIDLYSSIGNIIASNLDYSIEIAGGKTKIILNTSDLSPGVYNANCISGNKIARFRFVVSPR